MSELKRFTVTIGNQAEQQIDPYEDGMRIPFKIEPPITVSSPDFLQQQLNRDDLPTQSPYWHPVAYSTLVTHSIPAVATYGGMIVPTSVLYADRDTYPLNGADITADAKAKHQAEKQRFQDIVRTAFTVAINPYGEIELDFTFTEPIANVVQGSPSQSEE